MAGSTCQSFGSPCSKFDFPVLKVGTLDTLMQLSDELDKFDKYAENAIKRIARSWQNDVGTDEDPTSLSQLKVPDFGTGDVSAFDGIQKFRWCDERFQYKDPLPDLARKIHKQIVDMDEEVKASLGA